MVAPRPRSAVYAEREWLSKNEWHEHILFRMDRFLRRLAIIAALVLAVAGIMATALALGFPDTPQYVWKTIVFICAISLICLLIWFSWEIIIVIRERARSLLANVELRWPIAKRPGWPQNAGLSSRIYNFRCSADFGALSEYRITLDLAFFNGSHERIVLDRLSGTVGYDNISLSKPPEAPHPVSGQAHTGDPLSQFSVSLEQRVSTELAAAITDYLATGKPLTLNLTGLTVWLRPASGGDSFEVLLWQGIVCAKEHDTIVCNRLVRQDEFAQVGAVGTASRPY
jgi:hypothetical protein